ncbi:MAG: 2-dehydropantoate 2-reductase [Pseudomonadota bacterium]
MKITVVGAGAMGASYGGHLARTGHEVTLVDTWQDHVDAINRDGLRLEGVLGEHRLKLPAHSSAPGGDADVAIVFVDTNNTAKAAETLAGLLAPDGVAITFQNGIGNVEKLQAALGAERVLGGSSMCSAATGGPGHVVLTHMGTTSVGETATGGGGEASERVQGILEALRGAGFEAVHQPNIMGLIWQKFVVNCGVNAIAATTGLRSGEIVRVPELDAFQNRILEEVMAVTKAKGIQMPDPEVAAKLKANAHKKFNKPSMLQHVEAGRQTEIEALNAALVREAKALGVPVPNNEALVALLKGRELHHQRRTHEPDLDYDAWEARIAAGEE